MCPSSRRENGHIASYVAIFAATIMGKKGEKRWYVLRPKSTKRATDNTELKDY